MKANYHTHTVFSDGKNTAEEIAQAAIEHGFGYLGFSDHSPVHFEAVWNMQYDEMDEYVKTIKEVKEKFEGKIEIFLGMEIDFFDGLNTIEYFKRFGLDYTIGSVHFLGKLKNGHYFNIDKSNHNFIKGLEEIYDNNVRRLAEDYYAEIVKMVKNDPPDIIAHLNLIEKFNKNNRYIVPEDKWYRDLVCPTLDVIAQSNCILEINARSLYRDLLDDFAPSYWMIQYAKGKNIPVTISGDVHKTSEFGLYWNKAVNVLKAAGYSEIVILTNQGWKEIGL